MSLFHQQSKKGKQDQSQWQWSINMELSEFCVFLVLRCYTYYLHELCLDQSTQPFENAKTSAAKELQTTLHILLNC